MKKKLFLLIIFLTPCLSWAVTKSIATKQKDRRPANLTSACMRAKATKMPIAQTYSLGMRSQVDKIKGDIAEIIKKQSPCDGQKI